MDDDEDENEDDHEETVVEEKIPSNALSKAFDDESEKGLLIYGSEIDKRHNDTCFFHWKGVINMYFFNVVENYSLFCSIFASQASDSLNTLIFTLDGLVKSRCCLMVD